jgi:hypothetical protein
MARVQPATKLKVVRPPRVLGVAGGGRESLEEDAATKKRRLKERTKIKRNGQSRPVCAAQFYIFTATEKSGGEIDRLCELERPRL